MCVCGTFNVNFNKHVQYWLNIEMGRDPGPMGPRAPGPRPGTRAHGQTLAQTQARTECIYSSCLLHSIAVFILGPHTSDCWLYVLLMRCSAGAVVAAAVVVAVVVLSHRATISVCHTLKITAALDTVSNAEAHTTMATHGRAHARSARSALVVLLKCHSSFELPHHTTLSHGEHASDRHVYTGSSYCMCC